MLSQKRQREAFLNALRIEDKRNARTCYGVTKIIVHLNPFVPVFDCVRRTLVPVTRACVHMSQLRNTKTQVCTISVFVAERSRLIEIRLYWQCVSVRLYGLYIYNGSDTSHVISLVLPCSFTVLYGAPVNCFAFLFPLADFVFLHFCSSHTFDHRFQFANGRYLLDTISQREKTEYKLIRLHMCVHSCRHHRLT